MSLQQAQIDLRNRHFTIWDSSAEGKSRNAHRKLKMTEETFRIFERRLSVPGVWVFPSSKNDDPRTTLQKAHERATRGKKTRDGKYEGGCGVGCRLYDMRHTFATRFALSGGSLPVLAKILGHADLSLLMRYVHSAQADMDRVCKHLAQNSKKCCWSMTRGKSKIRVGLGQLLGQPRHRNWPKLSQLSLSRGTGGFRERVR